MTDSVAPPICRIDRAFQHPQWRPLLLRIAVVLVVLDLAIVAFFAGVRLRRWAFDYTQPIRFVSDIQRNYRYGQRAVTEGYLNVYENVDSQRAGGNYELDYSPLRLLLFAQWGHWIQRNFPEARDWRPDRAFHAFVLRFNTAMELAAAVGVFLIVRLWVARGDAMLGPPPPSRLGAWLRRVVLRRPGSGPFDAVPMPASPRPFRGWGRAFVAAMLVWFNPAMILSAHGWPTWDMWIIPFFVWAVLFASLRWWFWCGVVTALGAMFKGQMLFVAPIFVLWPLLAGEPGAALRALIGFAWGACLVIWPWMLSYKPAGAGLTERTWDVPAIGWVAGAVLAVLTANAHRLLPPGKRHWWLPVLAPVAMLILWPFARTHSAGGWSLGVLLAGSLLAASWLLAPRRQPLVLAAGVSATLLLCIPLFHGGLAWWHVGFLYGTEKHPFMIVGPANNLAALLQLRFGWSSIYDIVCTIAPHQFLFWPSAPTPLRLKYLLFAIYIVFFLLCTIGIAIQWRRQDPRFLIAVTAPWLMFFCIPLQIHDRYLLFAAGIGAATIAVNWGMAIVNLFLTFITWCMTMHVMLMGSGMGYGASTGSPFNAGLLTFVSSFHPDSAWAVLLCAAFFLYLSLAPRRRATTRHASAQVPLAAAQPLVPSPSGRGLG